jgi:hypothetical protein
MAAASVLTVRAVGIGGKEVRAVDARDLFVALDRGGSPAGWLADRKRRLGLEKGRDWISVPGAAGRVPLLTLPAAMEVACRDRGPNVKTVRDALAAAMSAPPPGDGLARVSERLDRLEKALKVRTGAKAKSPGRPRKSPGPGFTNDISALGTWRKVRPAAWDYLAGEKEAEAAGVRVRLAAPAALRRDLKGLMRLCGVREPECYRFARALERLAAREPGEFTFGKMRMRLMAYDNATVEDGRRWLLTLGSLASETRRNARGRETAYWTMTRRPLFEEDAGWVETCLGAAEGALDVRREGKKLSVQGTECARDDPDWPKLAGTLPTFSMYGEP